MREPKNQMSGVRSASIAFQDHFFEGGKVQRGNV